MKLCVFTVAETCLQRPVGLSFGQYTLQNTFQSPLLWLKLCSYLSFLCPALTARRIETKLLVGLQPLLAQPGRS